MTAAYDEFIREYNMTGSEKADGYSRSVFIGLEPHEKEEVFNLLLTELPLSAKWLFFLDSEKAIPIVKEEEKMWRGDKYKRVYMLQENLVEYTGDLIYQAHMIEDYPHYVDYLKPLVIDSIGRTPASIKSISFLQQVIMTETDKDAIARATRRILAVMNISRVTDLEKKIYDNLERELRSDDADGKLRIFAKMKQEHDDFLCD